MIGLSVQASQDTVSKDTWTVCRHIHDMIVNEQRRFNKEMVERVRRLREERGVTSEEMATILGVPAERYRKYEYRTPLPHYLIKRFAIIVGRDPEYILHGKIPPARPRPGGKSRKLA